MTSNEPNGVSRYRIEELERKVDKLSTVVTEAAVLKQHADEVDGDVTEIKTELKSIRRGLWVAAATFASLAVGVFSLIAQGLSG